MTSALNQYYDIKFARMINYFEFFASIRRRHMVGALSK